MSALTTTPTTGTPRFGRGTLIGITAIAGVIAVGVVTVPRLTTTTTDTAAVPVVEPSGLGGGAPSPREIAAQQRQQRQQREALSSGIRAMDPRAWTAVAGAMAAEGALPRSADAAERWLSSPTSPSVVGGSPFVKPTTPDVAERLGAVTAEPGPPRGMQRPRD